jgi:DNA end-binding protein Ku
VVTHFLPANGPPSGREARELREGLTAWRRAATPPARRSARRGELEGDVMARSMWKGSLSFGLVNIPVSVHSAEKSEELHFTLLDRRNKAPVHYQRINSKTGAEVPWDETVRGYEFEPDRYVVLSDEDLESANPKSTQTIEIVDFVALAAIAPSYFDRPYFLAPERQGAKSYALLRETLRRSGKVGIAKVVLRTRQHLAAVVPVDKAIVLNLMRFADELSDSADLDLPSGKQGLSEKELQMAARLVEAMVEPWDPERYRDDYRVDVKALIDRRVAAGELLAGKSAPPPRRPAGAKVLDLMALLKKSVEEGGGRKSARGTVAGGRAAPAKGKTVVRHARPPGSGRTRKSA